MLNLATVLEDSARTYPDREAVVSGSARLSFADVNTAANKVANLLVSRGIRAGDRVALSCPNVPWFPIVYFGILKMGAVVVPLNVLLKGREVAYHLNDSGARAFFCFEGATDLPMAAEGLSGFKDADECEHLFIVTADPSAESPITGIDTLEQALAEQSDLFDTVSTETIDTAVVLYTSGTTGQPKGAELTHSNLVLNALMMHRQIPGIEAGDVQLIALPLFHAMGQVLQMHTAFAAGNTIVLMPRFDPVAAIELIIRESVTVFVGVPTMWHGLLAALSGEAEAQAVATSLRVAGTGGAAMPVELMSQIRQRFGVRLVEGYGLSETSPVAAFTPRDGEPLPGSIGKPIWGVEMKLVNPDGTSVPDSPNVVGEIAIKGHAVMKGYLNRPEETEEVLKDGWFRTGDLARKDADGYYYIVDRAKEMIIRGGYNVYPRELEEVLMTHPAVSLVAVVGVPDARLGEDIKAFVLKQPGDPTTEADLVAWGQQQFAAYKYPRSVEFVERFPTTSTGKILKRELKATLP